MTDESIQKITAVDLIDSSEECSKSHSKPVGVIEKGCEYIEQNLPGDVRNQVIILLTNVTLNTTLNTLWGNFKSFMKNEK